MGWEENGMEMKRNPGQPFSEEKCFPGPFPQRLQGVMRGRGAKDEGSGWEWFRYHMEIICYSSGH